MLNRHGTLSLSPMVADPDEVVLVSSTEWYSIRADCDYHEFDRDIAGRMLERLDRQRSMSVHRFLAELRLDNFDIPRMRDEEVWAQIAHALRSRRVIAVQKGATKPD